MEYFDYVLDDFIPCEVCGARAVDIHHIENRGAGGDKNKDTIENLMACLLYTSPSPRDKRQSRMPSSA